MKLCLALMLATASQVAASSGYGQESVSLQLENARLSTILKTIQKKTDYRFVFSNKLVDETGMVNIKVQNTPVLSLLPRILNGTGLEYQQMSDNLIVIREKADIKKDILVKGTVTNAKGEPVSGATVSSNKGKATITNDKGEYSIEVDEFDELTFSYVGYTSQVIKVNSQQTINVVFEEANRALEEVVVTALGIKRQEKALGYATQKVGGTAVQTVKGVDLGTSLTGMVSGLVVKNSTEFNKTPAVQLRGESPLLVINGVPYGNMSLRDIPTDDIESIDVLKGATASALYGSRGGAGAIMITTKQGKGKRFAIDINSNNMFALGYVSIPKVQTSYGHGLDGKIATDYVWGPKLDVGDSAMQWNPITKKTEMMPLVSSGRNNLKNFLETGIISNNNISVTQSGENGFFRAGLNYIYNKGEWPNATLKIINSTMSGQMKLGKKFDLNASMGYTWEQSPQNIGGGYGDQGYLYQLLMWTGPDYDLRQYRDYWVTPNLKQNWLYDAWYDNPYLIAYEKLLGSQNNKLNASLTANYNFNQNLKLMFRTGYDYYSNEITQRNPANINSDRGGFVAAGLFRNNLDWGFSTNNDLILTYDKTFGKFGVNALAGGSIYYYVDRSQGASTVNGLSIPGWYSLANAAPSTTAGVNSISNSYSNYRKQTNGLYGKASFSYDNGIYLDITGRNDWASTQQASQRSYFYPSAGLSFILSRYLALPDWVDLLKLRGSWTISKSVLGVYSTNRTFSSGTSFGLISNSYPSNLLGDNLLPSTNRTWEMGLASYLFKSRLHVDATYFAKLYYNRQVSASVSGASGFTSTLVNTKETYARRGMEITVDGDVIKTGNFKWHSTINWSFDHRYWVDLDSVYSTDDNWHKKGTRLDVYTTNEWARDPNGDYINVGGKPIKNPYATQIGYGDPNYSFGFINEFSLGNLIFGINIDGRIGGLMYNYIWDKMFDTGSNPETDNQFRYNQVVNKDNTFTAPGVKIVSGKASYDKYGNLISDTRTYAPNDVAIGYQTYARNFRGGNYGIMSESFVKLRQVSIGYNIPQNAIKSIRGLKSASVSVTGQNLILITKFKFSDPDRDTEDLNAPSQRMVGFNIKLGF
ncbi:SusC/RagA family TonB-linked outer membrane protein [Niabella sp. CC-SYL272]|uniref:SusC/RagA family TonB-linked outer membrane protein n=1 Tax=Niabella agricola TaxID=2891571 RepID=UPI001F1D6BC0|nr:SusC/RagA family TonB-linked outer membrane protein [Niabella agricola]MCF3110389.1 SusC/RagA family TonB-linked outer membrane protein [Niabella agricola]